MHILLIDDDLDFATSVKDALANLHEVTIATTGNIGETHVLHRTFDIILLDILLPDTNGITLCKHLRDVGIVTPILVLTGAHKGSKQTAKALRAGADDYLTKPFDIEELIARIHALIRRKQGSYDSDIISVHNITLDLHNNTVTKDGKQIELRKKEYLILKCLLINAGRVVTRSMLLERVWGNDKEPSTNAIDVHIKNLRNKLGRINNKHIITTVHGFGYKIRF